MTVLSIELCGAATCCPGMDQLDTTRAYPFDYESKVLSTSTQYEWMGYISFPYDVVYLSGEQQINCASSFLYSTNVFYQWTQVNANLCVYNSSYTNMFIALRQISASQTLTIYFDETRRRNLCGVCNCDPSCEQGVAIGMGVFAGLFILICLFICVKSEAMKNIFNVGKKIKLKPHRV
jgi:hypothetical protein